MTRHNIWFCALWLASLATVCSCKKTDALSGGTPAGEVGTTQVPVPDLTKPATPTGKLTADDYVLLESAMQKYYHNGQPVSPQAVERNADVLLKYASGPDAARSVLATHAFVVDRCTKQLIQIQKSQGEIFKKLPAKIQQSALRLAVEQFPAGYEMDLEAIERATSGVTSMIDKARLEMVWQQESNVLLWQRFATATTIAEQTYAPLLGTEDLSTKQPFKVLTMLNDPVGVRIEGVYRRLEGRFLVLKYRGQQPLTNVLITTDLNSRGATSQLSKNQKLVDVFNQYVGRSINSDEVSKRYVDAADAARKIQMASNYYDSMPKSGFVFVRKLSPGDELGVPLGALLPEYVSDGNVSLFCDQGTLPTTRLKVYRDSDEEDASFAVGASEQHVRDYHSTLRTFKLSEWPKPPVPDLKHLPADTVFVTTARVDYPLPCNIFGFSKGKVVYRTSLAKEYIKPHIAGKDVKIGMSEKDARALFLDKCSTNGRSIEDRTWPVPPRPALSNLPKDTKYYEYGYHPDFFVVGYSGGKVVYAEYFRAPKRRGDPD